MQNALDEKCIDPIIKQLTQVPSPLFFYVFFLKIKNNYFMLLLFLFLFLLKIIAWLSGSEKRRVATSTQTIIPPSNTIWNHVYSTFLFYFYFILSFIFSFLIDFSSWVLLLTCQLALLGLRQREVTRIVPKPPNHTTFMVTFFKI